VFHLAGVARWHFESYVSCVVITEHRTPSIVIEQNPFMDWGSIPLEEILLYNSDVLASFELVIMVLWNVDQLLIVIRNDKIKNVENSNTPFTIPTSSKNQISHLAFTFFNME
jgi:hypothetical protein